MKRIFLASEAKNPESLKKLEEFVGGFSGKSIAYIPTASNGENGFEEWKSASESWQLVQKLTDKAVPIQLEDYKNDSVIKDLKNKDILWFAGGIPAYLMYWIIRCGLDKALSDLLEKSVYVGSSAGSMVCSKTLNLGALYPDEFDRNGFYLPGLGFVDFEIYPHYDESLLPMIKKVWKNGDLCLLKNGEAITIVGDKIEFLGEKRILRDGKIL